jgi:hypothetical protein
MIKPTLTKLTRLEKFTKKTPNLPSSPDGQLPNFAKLDSREY